MEEIPCQHDKVLFLKINLFNLFFAYVIIRYCVTSDAKSNKDCCLCLRKRVQPCKDNGCMSNGGLCVDIKNSYLSTSRFPRNVVNIRKPIVGQNGTSLCTNPNGPEKKMCCQCYEIKG